MAEASASSAPAAVAELAPGTYADVVTNDLVLRSEPGTSAESEMYPDRLNAPTSVYVADGPIAADGYAWYYVVAFDENGTVPALIGWAAAGGKDGEVWLDPVEHGNDAWSLLDTDDAPADLKPRSSAMGPDGQIYFFGGSDSSDEPAGHAWAFDPAAGAWRELAPMPTPRTGPMVAATPDGLFYVIGGSPGTTISSEDTSVVEVYDAETNRWTRTSNAPFAPDYFSAGGAIADTEGVIRVFTGGDVLRYDPATSEWEVESTGNTTLWDVAMGADSSIHVLEYGGGVHAYDLAAGTLGDGSGVNGITRYGAALSPGPDGSMLVFGGSVSPGLGATCTGFRGGAALSLVEALNPSTGEWSTIAPMPQPLADAAAFTTADGVLFVGRSVRTPADPAAPQGELVVVELSLGSLAESSELAATNQDPSPSGCGS
ncbi:MAG: Kelch repeat-containing protein [Candidatus Limnocylindria bacterium]